MRSDRFGIRSVPRIIRRLLGQVAMLERMFPEKKFTLDGHLVGSIGEVMAAFRYNLDLLPGMPHTHDARTRGRVRKKVQIKATQGNRVGIRSRPQYLLVLTIDNRGKFHEVYNGPGGSAYRSAGRMQRNGQRQISIHRLKNLQDRNVRNKVIKLPVRRSSPQCFD